MSLLRKIALCAAIIYFLLNILSMFNIINLPESVALPAFSLALFFMPDDCLENWKLKSTIKISAAALFIVGILDTLIIDISEDLRNILQIVAVALIVIINIKASVSPSKEA
jgi:hypothetical protein